MRRARWVPACAGMTEGVGAARVRQRPSGRSGRTTSASDARTNIRPQENSSLPPSRGETKRGVRHSARAPAVEWAFGARRAPQTRAASHPPPNLPPKRADLRITPGSGDASRSALSGRVVAAQRNSGLCEGLLKGGRDEFSRGQTLVLTPPPTLYPQPRPALPQRPMGPPTPPAGAPRPRSAAPTPALCAACCRRLRLRPGHRCYY